MVRHSPNPNSLPHPSRHSADAPSRPTCSDGPGDPCRTPRRARKVAWLTAAVLAATPILQARAVGQAEPPASPPPAATPAAPEATAQPATAPSAPISPAITQAAAEGLARVYAAFAGRTLRKDELALADLELSLLLGQQATMLNPNDVFAWRTLFSTTLLHDGTDPAIASIRREAMDRILALDPEDEVMKLRRIVDAVEDAPTAEERITRFETMLSDSNRAAIGDRIASQLALKLAMLYRRTGDVEQAERWMGEAVTIDPSSPHATAMAAGYFRFTAEESSQEAELLMTAMLANPLDGTALRAFATLLLDRGAYRGAARFLQVAADIAATDYPLRAYDQLLADLALVYWASGQPKAAEDLITKRQRKLNEFHRLFLARRDPSVLSTPDKLDARFPMQSSEIAVQAAVLRAMGETERWKQCVSDTYASFDNEISTVEFGLKNLLEEEKRSATPEEEQSSKEQRASISLQAALFAFWIGEDRAKGEAYVKAADAVLPLGDAAKARFAAWAQLRSDEPAKALPMFEALDDDSPAAAMGKALAQVASGDLKTGARSLLAVWQSQRGSLLGVDARARLSALLGAAVPDDEPTARLEAVASSVPESFDRMFRPGARPLSARIVWGTRPQSSLDPIPFTLEIGNTTQWPLAIGDAGPIREVVNLQGSISAANRSASIDLAGVMASVGRVLSVPPRSTLRVPFDLAYTDFGVGILQFAQTGCTVSLRSIVNWKTTEGGFRPDDFGDEALADLLRIEGIRMTDEWLSSVLQRAPAPQSRQDLIDLAAAVSAAVEAHQRPKEVSDARKSQFDALWAALPGILRGYDPVILSWLLVVFPDDVPPMMPALAVARESGDPLVRLSYLVRRVSASTDPILDEAIASGNERIVRYGTIVREMLRHDEEVTRRDFNLGTGGAGGAANGAGTDPATPPTPGFAPEGAGDVPPPKPKP